MRIIAAVMCAFAFSACVAFRFSPGESIVDPTYFAEKPHVIKRSEGYVLRWRYGSFPYYFLPEYQIIDGDLVFVLRAFTSTGHAAEKVGEIEIKKGKAVEALDLGRAYWWEPDGSRVRIEIKEEPNQLLQTTRGDVIPDSGSPLQPRALRARV